ncbi:guanidinobutyrase-1 [Elsinoe australis]|uniref:Guanidinobutyrase-1 n=1 Tax=Elsinoe australis TaxID=40998 RepID=A0A4U7B778_9PEZI|nr:guanidinobutyrase-1 [Elsinoe australis]
MHWVQLLGLTAVPFAAAHSHHDHHFQKVFTDSELQELERKWGTDWGFSGISTFAHLPHVKCLTNPSVPYDIAVLGAPFDTAVSYRPGARFGPRAIRSSSGRQTALRGYNPRAKLNPYTSWATILDCGDIPVTPFDNMLALRQMTEAFSDLSTRSATSANKDASSSYKRKPKILTLGGDHSVALPALRALRKAYDQPITVVHFDAHLDTWHPAKYPSAWVDFTSLSADNSSTWTEPSFFTHGNMFWLAHLEGLIAGNTSVHAGLRTRLSGVEDDEEDERQGWYRIPSDRVMDQGWSGVAWEIKKRVTESDGTGLKDKPVYLSIDIDIIDPGLAPATGTPEPGGWSTRELIRVLRGIEELNIVGADVVEVSPAYDGPGEQTSMAAAQVVFEVLTSMVKRGLAEDRWNEHGPDKQPNVYDWTAHGEEL